MYYKDVTIVTDDPWVVPLAEMALIDEGVLRMAEWVRLHRPDCVPPGGFSNVFDLLPHGAEEEFFDVDVGPDNTRGGIVGRSAWRDLSDNELLVEIAGRKCYDSFAEKAGRKTNRDYIENTQKGNHPHKSILYHAKVSLFLAGISRRVSHELIRNYVGADRDQEGNPSQESTRFTHHYGWYVAHPRDIGDGQELEFFRSACQRNYDDYCSYIERQVAKFKNENGGEEPKGLTRKRIYESAAGRLGSQAETSFIWTSNPGAITKLCLERSDDHADLEFQRLARLIGRAVVKRSPNLYPELRASALFR